MTYTKPEIVVLGNASTVIQGGKFGRPIENFILKVKTATPAYDLDE